MKMYPLWGLYPQPVHFGHFGRKCAGWGFFLLNQFILAILSKNVPLGCFLFSSCTFGPFCEKIWRPAVFYSQPVYFGHWGENVPAGCFLFSAGSSVVFFSQLVHFGHFGQIWTG